MQQKRSQQHLAEVGRVDQQHKHGQESLAKEAGCSRSAASVTQH
jgi:hypothetical protein